MGIDIHAFNFIRMQAKRDALGSTLTIGRQSLSLSPNFILENLGTKLEEGDGYCERLLEKMNASSVESIDFSNYENPTYTGDLNKDIDISKQFDTIIDAGSLEHVFDTAAAFRNLIKFCKVGGRIVHILPVNNLSGHGFWQFSSDLMYSIYKPENGFSETEVYYASGLDFENWYLAPSAAAGKRIEIVSIEPIILMSVTRKAGNVDAIKVTQPFYENAWKNSDATEIQATGPSIISILKKTLKTRGKIINSLRNAGLVFGLAIGKSRFSIKHPKFKEIIVKDLFREQAT